MPSSKKLMLLSILLGVLGLGGFSGSSVPFTGSLVQSACAFTSCDPGTPNCCSCVQCRPDQDGDRYCTSTAVPKCGIACPAGYRSSTDCYSVGPDCNDSDASTGYIPAQTCPTTCHTNTQTLPDGNCGTTTCLPNNPTSAPTCPTTCHTNTQTFTNTDCSTLSCPPNTPAAQSCSSLPCHTATQNVPDGNCGQTACAPNPPAYQPCPTGCGQPAQNLSDGACGTHSCAATTPCYACPTNTPQIGGWNNDGYASPWVYSGNSCTANGAPTTTYHYFQYAPDFEGATYLGGWSTNATSSQIYLGNRSTPCGCHYRFTQGLSVNPGPSMSDTYTGYACLSTGCWP